MNKNLTNVKPQKIFDDLVKTIASDFRTVHHVANTDYVYFALL